MKLFCSDLDNTLIYSYKKDIGNEKVLIEEKDGKEISFITIKTIELLKCVQKNYLFIPITTRSVEQYHRIRFHSKCTPNYALVANGGILLRNNKIDEKWYDKTKEIISDAMSELYQSIRLLEKSSEICFEVRMVGGLFVFTKSLYPTITVEHLKRELDLSKVNLFVQKQKLYIIPKILNKGYGLIRLKEWLKADYVVAAGDSEFDVSMLRNSDVALMPEELSACVTKNVG